MNMIKRKVSKSIRKNLVLYSFSIIFIMTVLSIYSLGITRQYMSQIDNMFEKHIYLSSIEDSIKSLDENLLGFLSTKSSSKLNNYLITIENLDGQIDDFYKTGLVTNDLTMKNIKNLVEQYKVEAELGITFKRQRNVNEYYKHYDKSVKIKGFIDDYIVQMNERHIDINSITYKQLVNHSISLQMITGVIVISLILLAILMTYLLTSKMVKPFSKLYKSAEEISRGNFYTEDVIIESDNEFKLLAESFNKMKNSIGSYVDELKVTAETENKLKDEQMKNLKMAYLLDNAKLNALQSQINPHFLFNTINAGVQLSVIEGATKTGDFLDSMSRLFRYNLRMLNEVCTLEDEIGNISDYYDLLKVRFGDRIKFEFELDQKTLSLELPPMILQPIVENSFIHGLSSLESGGTINIVTKEVGQQVIITITDNGVGMDNSLIDEILSRKEEVMVLEKKSDSGLGLGVRNVRDRLELFYHRRDIFQMSGEVHRGVQTTLTIPKKTID